MGIMRIDMVVRCTSAVIRASCAMSRDQPRILRRSEDGVVADQRLRDHHLADHVEQVIELGRLDADGEEVGGLRSLRGESPGFRRSQGRRRRVGGHGRGWN